ncbi:hypothetical protein [Clostridium perfringens]|uniref:hypothetical protein n=1 Tax=Clostridium perfringens TaxID=1502 RepID=UPI0020473270|nr:hypothetical protein [Clostridium perfringens]MDU5039209.1 hypothetical protein [Clostridium perfringens]DAP07271.1 MAG TPA: hypothetical protein [Caudoviricetes sp.]
MLKRIFYSDKQLIILKIASFISSMAPFSVYLMLVYYNDYYSFWGIKILTPHIGALLTFIICILSIIYIYIFYRFIINNIDRSNEYIKLINLKKDKANTTNYLLTNVLPIVGISMDTENKSLFAIFILIILGFMYIKNDLYSTNPIYDLFNIKTYTGIVQEIDIDNPLLVQNEYEATILVRNDLLNFSDTTFICIKHGDTIFVKD